MSRILPAALARTLVKDSTGFGAQVGKLLRNVQPLSLRLNTALGSQYERETQNPGLRYQFALGDLEHFRRLGIDSAIAATETGRLEARSGMRFSKFGSVDLTYSEVEFQSFDKRGGSRLQRDRIWPNVQLNLTELPLPGFMRPVLPRVGGRVSFEHVRKHLEYGSATGSDRAGQREFHVAIGVERGALDGRAADCVSAELRGIERLVERDTDHSVVRKGAGG